MIEKPNFERWIAHVFDHPEGDADWHRRNDSEHWSGDASGKAVRVTETFDRAGETLGRFTDRQLQTGLWFILSEGYAADAMKETVPLELRLALVRSTRRLFETLLAVRCPDLDFGGNEPLYRVCYMFWELFPRGDRAPEAELSRLVTERFTALEQILALDNAMCQYSALHGLGHLRFKDAGRAESIIDRYLARHSGPGFVLRDYALDARRGDVQ